jgi:hypothetical protein
MRQKNPMDAVKQDLLSPGILHDLFQRCAAPQIHLLAFHSFAQTFHELSDWHIVRLAAYDRMVQPPLASLR